MTKKRASKKLIKENNTGNSLAVFELAKGELGLVEGKSEFEIYQMYRNFFVGAFHDPEKAKHFYALPLENDPITKLQLFDPAYKDNFLLCLTIKFTAPAMYSEMLQTIDKYVRPKKQRDGLNNLSQECAGFLVLLLQHYEKVSVRQAVHLVSQLTRYSESTIENSYREKKRVLHGTLGKELPSAFSLLAVFAMLHFKKVDFDKVEPFEKTSERSKKKTQKTIAAYRNFTERVLRPYQENILAYLQNNPLEIISAAFEAYDVKFPVPESQLQQQDVSTILAIIIASVVIEFMPDVLEKIDFELRNETLETYLSSL